MPKNYRQSIKKSKRDVEEDEDDAYGDDYPEEDYLDGNDESEPDLSSSSSSTVTTSTTTTTSTPSPITTHTHRHHHGNGNKIDSPITSVNDLVPPNGTLTEDIKSSVSELESVITKTIENTENIEDIPSLIIEYNNSKEEGGEPSTISITTTTTTTQLPTTINQSTKLPTTILSSLSSSSQPPSSSSSTTTRTTTTTAKTSSTIAQTETVFENSSTRELIEDTLTTVDFVEKVIEPELMTTHKDITTSTITTTTSTTTISTASVVTQRDPLEESLENLAKGEDVSMQSSTEQSSEATSSSTSTTTTTTPSSTTIAAEVVEEGNSKPEIKNRVQMQRVTAGKFFKITIPEDTFYDKEDGTKLKLVLLDRNKEPIVKSAWIQFDDVNRVIYGLPLEETVSRWQFNLVATDSKDDSVTESVEIAVQQHKGHRIANNEITIDIILMEKYRYSVDWQLELAKAISDTVGEQTFSTIVVRDITYDKENPNRVYFKFTNETLTKDECPQKKLDQLIAFIFTRLPEKLNETRMQIQAIDGQLIGTCQIKVEIPKTKLTPQVTKNYPPVPRNQVDRVNATVGHLMVFKVPQDTFYDPEDSTNLKLSLLTMDRKNISEKNWLQFDSKNQEFYGIPKFSDQGSEDYILVAEDREGLQATDALVVVTENPPRRDYPVYFKLIFDIKSDDFRASAQRKFVEKLAGIFSDSSTNYIQIRSINPTPDFDGTIVTIFNTTLHKVHNQCPEDRISYVINMFLHHDNMIKDNVRRAFKDDFKLKTLSVVGACQPRDHDVYSAKMPNMRNPISSNPSSTSTTTSTLSDDYLYSFIIPAIIIVSMILLASIVACILHRRKLTGKMEIGDEEEKKSFRSKGIPVIFQDELEEKPDIGNKSPIILKYEKPPLLPHNNKDGDNDVQKYLPPLSGYIGGREQRGKSPVTPSYRKPPPYVSP
ncbi:DAG1 family protein [Megaselia abdita]